MYPKSEIGARVVAVDVCGTLYDENTTAGFIRHHHKRVGNWRLSLMLKLITGYRQPLRAAFILYSKVTGFDIHRAVILATLRRQTHVELEVSAQSYLETLEPRRIGVVYDRVREMEKNGWSPVLVSNSIDLIVNLISKKLDLPYVSSQIGWNNGHCTGRLAVDLTGKKRVHLEEFLRSGLNQLDFSVITDNKSDLDLIDCAHEALVIAHRGKKKWMEKSNVEIIHL